MMASSRLLRNVAMPITWLRPTRTKAEIRPPISELSPPFMEFCTAFERTRSRTRSNGASWPTWRFPAIRNSTNKKPYTTALRRTNSHQGTDRFHIRGSLHFVRTLARTFVQTSVRHSIQDGVDPNCVPSRREAFEVFLALAFALPRVGDVRVVRHHDHESALLIDNAAVIGIRAIRSAFRHTPAAPCPELNR